MWTWRHLDRVIYGAVLVLLVAAPLMRGFRFVHDDVVLLMPDLNETWLSAMSAGHFDQNVGPWSRIGLFHPGPMWFYWCAPFVALADGEPAGLFLAALALVSVCSALIVEEVRRSLGISAALVSAFTVAVALLFLDPTGLAFPWNPTVLILPAAVGMVSVARAAAQRSVGSACLAILSGWFVVQSHLGALPLGGAILLAGVVLATRALAPTWRTKVGWITVTAVCVLVPVVPIVRDQIAGEGNAVAAARYAVTGTVSPRFPADPPSESANLSASEVMQESSSVTTLIQGDIARWAGADLLLARRHQPLPGAPWVLLGLTAVAAVAGWSLRRAAHHSARHSSFVGWLGLVACVAVVIQSVVAVRAAGEFRPYLIAASAGVGVVLWLVAALFVHQRQARRVRTLSVARRNFVKSCFALGLLVPVGLFVRPPLEGLAPKLQPSRDASQQIESAIDGGHVRLTVDRIDTLLASQQLVAALEREGMTVTIEGRESAHFGDRQRRADAGAVGIEILLLDPTTNVSSKPIATMEDFIVVRTSG
jgi:hypothetical protein